MSAQRLEPYATLDAAGIPRNVLGEQFAVICERLEDTAPPNATESDIYRKAGFYLDDRGTLDWEDDDVCKLDSDAIKCADRNSAGDATLSVFDAINAVFAPPHMRAESPAPREFWAVLDRDDNGDVYTDAERARQNAAIWNESRTLSTASQRPYRVVHLREVAA